MTGSEKHAYFDSSVVLAILMQEPSADSAASLWDAFPQRVASVLLEAECRTVLRRAARALALTLSLVEAERHLDAKLAQVALHEVDRRVLRELSTTVELGRCRTLDAVQLATALCLRQHFGSDLAFVTFDKDLAAVARDVGFPVLGADG